MKLLNIALLAGMALTGLSTLPATAQEASVLNIVLQDDPDTLDPATNWSFVGRHVLQSLCDKIVDIDEQGQIVPMLAESWEWSADGKVLTLHIRHGATFHDGEPVNAEAIKYNLDRDLTLDISRRKAEISSIASVDVIDDYTVKINLKQASVPLLAAFTDRPGMIISPKAGKELGDNFTNNPVCSGPYKFVKRVVQDHIELEKFKNYWNADKYHFDKLIYRGIPDSNVRLLNLRSGQADLIERLATSDVASVQQDAKLKTAEVIGLGYYGITIDIGGPGANLDFAQKQAVREAFSLAIDRDAINQVVFQGQFAAGNQPFPPNSPYYDKSLPVATRDVDAAKAKMKEAGLTSVDVELSVPTDAERQQVAQVIQSMVSEVGIKVSIRATELTSLLDIARAGNFQTHLIGWSGRVDPDLNITPMLACGAAGNDAHYCNKGLDDILTQARAIGDTDARKAKYAQAVSILLKDLPIVYLYHSKWIYAFKTNLQGFRTYPDGIIRLTGLSRS